MSDILAKIENDIQHFTQQYEEIRRKFERADSDGGRGISNREQEILNEVTEYIQKLRMERQKRRQIVANMSMTKVVQQYQNLYDAIDLFIDQKVAATYEQWQTHILDAGTAYANAYKTFEDTVNAQNKYKDDLQRLVGEAVSIVGLGTFAWLSGTGAIAVVVKKVVSKNVDLIANVTEDVVQVAFDKVAGHMSDLPSEIKTDDKVPLSFQNQLSKKAIQEYIKMKGSCVTLKYMVHEYRKKVNELNLLGKGNAVAEYNRYLMVESMVQETLTNLSSWVSKRPPSISTAALEMDFERVMWTKWLPKLKGQRVERIPYRDEFGVRFPNGGETYTITTFDTWFSSALKGRMRALIDLKSINVDLWWTDASDVKNLINWANSFKPTTTF